MATDFLKTVPLTVAFLHQLLSLVVRLAPPRRPSANAGFIAAGVELVDPRGLTTLDRHHPVDSGFTAQRAWSNRAAAADQNPCVPAPADDPYLHWCPLSPPSASPGSERAQRSRSKPPPTGPVASWSVDAIDLTGQHADQRYLDLALNSHRVVASQTATFIVGRSLRTT